MDSQRERRYILEKHVKSIEWIQEIENKENKLTDMI